MVHRVKVGPVRVRDYSELTGCDVRRVVGYRASCSCGARSKVERTMSGVRAWAAAHRR